MRIAFQIHANLMERRLVLFKQGIDLAKDLSNVSKISIVLVFDQPLGVFNAFYWGRTLL